MTILFSTNLFVAADLVNPPPFEYEDVYIRYKRFCLAAFRNAFTHGLRMRNIRRNKSDFNAGSLYEVFVCYAAEYTGELNAYNIRPLTVVLPLVGLTWVAAVSVRIFISRKEQEI